jgi:hypothetical protein
MEQGRRAGVRKQEKARDSAIPQMVLSPPKIRIPWDQAGAGVEVWARDQAGVPDRDQVWVTVEDPVISVETDGKEIEPPIECCTTGSIYL